MTAKKTSLKDLSDYLGLSQTTVSRGLADYPEVAARTKTRIRQAAAELNYAPSSSAQKLATGRALAIGHVITLSDHMTLNPFYADFIAGAGETYADSGYDMLISMVSRDKELETYRALTNSQKVDGFVLSEPVPDDPRIALLQELAIPFIVHGRTSASISTPSDYSWLDVNNKRGFETASRYLLELGHRQIALINGPDWLSFAQRRKAGFEAALLDCGVTCPEAWIFATDMSERKGFEIASQLLQQRQRPTAILCSSMLLALGVQRAMHSQGLQIGADISLICWDDCLSAFDNQTTPPQFTSMRSSIFDAGAMVAECLLAQIESPTTLLHARILEAELVKGQSTGPVKS